MTSQQLGMMKRKRRFDAETDPGFLDERTEKFEVARSSKEIFVYLQNETDLWMETR